MKILRWLDENFEKTICMCLMTIMVCVLFLQVIMRRVFSDSLPWSEELARYIFIWLIYIGISYAAQLKRHIKLDLIAGRLSEKAQPWFYLVGDVLFLVFALVIIVQSFDIVGRQITLGQTSPALNLPMWIVYAAPFVGFILTSIRQLQVIINSLKEIRTGTAKKVVADGEIAEILEKIEANKGGENNG